MPLFEENSISNAPLFAPSKPEVASKPAAVTQQDKKEVKLDVACNNPPEEFEVELNELKRSASEPSKFKRDSGAYDTEETTSILADDVPAARRPSSLSEKSSGVVSMGSISGASRQDYEVDVEGKSLAEKTGGFRISMEFKKKKEYNGKKLSPEMLEVS